MHDAYSHGAVIPKFPRGIEHAEPLHHKDDFCMVPYKVVIITDLFSY